MRKLMTWILLAVMCVSCCVVPAAAEEAEAAKRILSDWFDYLYANEKLCNNMLWALEAVQKYCEDTTWENQQIASLVNTTAAMYIKQRNLDEPLASDEDYNLFVAQDKDLGFLKGGYFDYELDKADALLGLQNLLSYMEYSAFWQYGLMCVQEEIDLQMQLVKADQEYLSVTTRYILAQLGESAETENFRAFVEEHCPNIHGAYQTKNNDVATLEAAAVAVLDRNEELLIAEEELGGVWEYMLDEHKNCSETGDWSRIMEQASEIEGLPLLLPDPGWNDSDGYSVRYYWRDEESKMIVPAEGEKVDRVPDGYLMKRTDLNREEVVAYCDYLAELGLEADVSESTDEYEARGYMIGDSTFIVEWKNGAGSILMEGNLLGFAPLWYLLAMAQ